MSGASSLRFWGKIYGSEKDYLVVEGQLSREEEVAKVENAEKRG